MRAITTISFIFSLFFISCIGEPRMPEDYNRNRNTDDRITETNNHIESEGNDLNQPVDSENTDLTEADDSENIDTTDPVNDTDEEPDSSDTLPSSAIAGIWLMDTDSITEIESNCLSLVGSGVKDKPYRKLIATDESTITMKQCAYDDDPSCPEIDYEIGVFDYDDGYLYGTATIVQELGPYCITSKIEPNEITFLSDSEATVYNKIHVTFMNSSCTTEASFPRPCVHEIEYSIDKVQQ